VSEGTPPRPAASGDGIVYSCSGEDYLAEALRSARSSMRHNKLPHVLFATADAETEEGLEIVRFEPSANPYADKIANMRRSPFRRTIYLDTDTYVVDEIAHLLALLDRYDVAAAFAPGYRGLPDPQVPAAFYELNTGVVAWRASERMSQFMRAWQETYLAWLDDEPFAGAGQASPRRLARSRATGRTTSLGGGADQPAFRRCAWQHDVRLLVLAPEYNLRLGEPATVVERVRVIHGRSEDFPALAARINATHGPRTWPPRVSSWRAGLMKLRVALRRVARSPKG
jgi:hypothetical protein